MGVADLKYLHFHVEEQRILFKVIIKNDRCCKCEARLFVIKTTSGKNFQVNLAIVFVFAAVVVAIGPGNDPASSHIISTSAYYQSDNLITQPGLDNDHDSKLIRNDGCCKCEVRKTSGTHSGSKLITCYSSPGIQRSSICRRTQVGSHHSRGFVCTPCMSME